MKKFLCLVLITIMTLSLVVSVGASTSDNSAQTTYKPYDEATDGELLYKANFSGDSYWKPSKDKGASLAGRYDAAQTIIVTPDPIDSTRANVTSNIYAGFNYWGDKVSGLPLGEEYNYTVRFTLTTNSTTEGLGLFIDGQKGVYVRSTQGCLQNNTLRLNGHEYVNYYGGRDNQEYAVEIIGYTIVLYVNQFNTTWVKVDEATFAEYASENLCLSIYTFHEVDIDIYDLKVYKGLEFSNPHVHEFVFADTVEPTCTEVGYESWRCECEAEERRNKTDALGHTLGEWIEVAAPTCTKTGVRAKKCSTCGGNAEIEFIPALGHTAGERIETKAPTCTETGTKKTKCSVCGGDAKTEFISALGHSYGEWAVTKEPTYTEDGIKTKTCTQCGDTITENIPRTESVSSETVEENQRRRGIAINLAGCTSSVAMASVSLVGACAAIFALKRGKKED